MQGELIEEQQAQLNFLTRAYENKRAASEFLSFNQFTIPSSVDEAYARSKVNIPKFTFYYLVVWSIFLVFVLLSHPVLVIPVTFSGAIFYASSIQLKVREIEITPLHALYGCIGLNLFLILVSRSIAHSFLMVLSFSSVTAILVLLHASLSRETESEATENI